MGAVHRGPVGESLRGPTSLEPEMNHRRKRPRKQVKCAICTPHRMGNTKAAYGQGTHAKASMQAYKQTGAR